MGRPSKAEARDTRREILDAALDLFSESGFDGTSMRQLARAVGVRESALYHHFPSKDALFTGLLEEYGPERAELVALVDMGAIEEAGVPRMLRQFARHILEEWSTPRERKWMRLVLSEATRMGPASPRHFPGALNRVLARFTDLFDQLMRKRVIRRGDPAVYAHEWMAGMMMIRLRMMVFTGETVDLGKAFALADAHVDFFWSSVRRDP